MSTTSPNPATRGELSFGASGGGSQVVEEALAHDHGVVAFVRTPGKLMLRDAKLTVVDDRALHRPDRPARPTQRPGRLPGPRRERT